MNERIQDFRVRQNLGISQETYRIKTLADLLAVPSDRRAVLCQALFAWLANPNTRVPKRKWLSLHFWLGSDLPEFVWQDDGTLPTAKVIATLQIDATEAIDTIRRAVVSLVEQDALPQSVLDAFDNARHKAEAPQRDAALEERAQKAIAGLVHEYGLRVQDAGNGATWYTAQPKFGSLDRNQKVTTLHTSKASQVLEHLENWLRHHTTELDTVSTLRRQLRAVPPGWIVQWTADVAGTTVGVWRLFQPVPSHEAEHPCHSQALGNSETSEFEALRIALGMFIDTKTLADCKTRFGNMPPMEEAFPASSREGNGIARKPRPLPFGTFPGYDDLMKAATEALAMKNGALVAGFRHGVMSVPTTPEQMKDANFFLGVQKGRNALAVIQRRALGETGDDPVLNVYAGVEEEHASMKMALEETSDILQRTTLPDITTVRTGLASQAYKLLKRAVDAEDAQASKAVTRQVVCPVCHEPLFNFAKDNEPKEGKLTCTKCDLHIAFDRKGKVGRYILAPGKTPLDSLRDLLAVQGSPGNWDYSPYLLGMFNGMELAVAIFEDREPAYRKMPEGGWIEDRKDRPAEVPAIFNAAPGSIVGAMPGAGTNASTAPLLPETAVLDASDLPEPEPTAAVEPPADTKGHEAIQALEKANPGAPGLIGKDAPRVHVFLSELLGQFARYAVAQSPYLHPDGLLEVLDAIKGDILDRFDPVLLWAELNHRDIEAMLNEAIMALPQVSAWNQRKNGNTSEFAFTGRMPEKRDPDNDFIDLQALITNVALACTGTQNGTVLHIVESQPVDGSGLWRYAEGDGNCKYLVLRRDGSIPKWPWFVMGACDEAAIQAVAAYAWYASLLKYPPQFVADVERLAREMAAYRQENGPGNPAGKPHRPTHPAILTLLRAHQRGESARIMDAANWIPEKGEA